MGSFWSGTDDKDERRQSRIFGVVGHVDYNIPASLFRIRAGLEFLDLRLYDVFASPDRTQTTVSIDLAATCGIKDGSKDGEVTFKYLFDPFKDCTFPEEWLGQVTRPVVKSYLMKGDVGVEGGMAEGGQPYHSPFPRDSKYWSQGERNDDRFYPGTDRSDTISNAINKDVRLSKRQQRKLNAKGGKQRPGTSRLFYTRGNQLWERHEDGTEHMVPDGALGSRFDNQE
jgi:hypothetical protein